MSKLAWAYIWGVLLVGLALSVYGIATLEYPIWDSLLPFAVLTALATVAQLFEAEHGKQSFYPHFVFFIAATLLLQPGLFVLVVALPPPPPLPLRPRSPPPPPHRMG